jgi:hypothetical protein
MIAKFCGKDDEQNKANVETVCLGFGSYSITEITLRSGSGLKA